MLVRYNPDSWFGLSPFADSEWSPRVRGFEALRREMDRLFSGYERSFDAGLDQAAAPALCLQDNGDSLVLSADLPGLSPKDLDLSITGDTVVLKGERKVQVPDGYSVHRQERGSYSFQRAYRLPSKVEADKAQASLKNGVLTVTLPKAAEAKPRSITVKAS